MSLLTHHLDDLRRSGLTGETIQSWGCFSIDFPSESLLKPFSKGVTAPGLAFPILPPGKFDHVGFTYKPDNPRVLKKNGKSRICKYEFPKRAINHIHVPRASQCLFQPPDGREGPMRMVLTEGQKKAEKAAQEGIGCIALPGVWNWLASFGGVSVPIEDLAAIDWPRYAVEICFDSDAAGNPHVRRAEQALARWLRSRGAAKVSIVRIPQADDGAKVGLDDFLISHSVQEFEDLPREDDGDLPLADAVGLLDPDTEKKERTATLVRILIEEKDPAEQDRLFKLAVKRTGISLRALRGSAEATGRILQTNNAAERSATPEELERIRHEEMEAATEAILDQAQNRITLHAQAWIGTQLIYVCSFGQNQVLLLSSNGTVIPVSGLPRNMQLAATPPNRAPISPDGVRRFKAGEVVSAVQLFEELRSWFARHAIFKDPSVSTALALWTMGTYVYGHFNYYGYLWFTSLGPSHGKSLVEKLLSMLCFNATAPLTVPTPATLFRDTEANGGTLILDEIENLDPEKKGEVISILNAGFERGGCVPRAEPVGDKWTVRQFAVYCPKAIAGISQLPRTLQTRAFQINMPKRKPGEHIDAFEPDRLSAAADKLRDSQCIFALRNAGKIAEMYARRAELVPRSSPSTQLPLPDRLRDVLAPLYAIAAVIDAEAGDLVATPGLDGFTTFQAGSRNSDSGSSDYVIALQALFGWAVARWRNGRVLIKTAEAIELFRTNEIAWVTDHGKAQALLRKLGARNDSIWWNGKTTQGYVFREFELQDLVDRHPIRTEEPPCPEQEH